VEAFSGLEREGRIPVRRARQSEHTIVYTYGPFTSSLTSTVQREKDNIVRFGVNYKLF
jgi:hypothetical protein